MARVLVRLLAAISLLFMPFGMANAAAIAPSSDLTSAVSHCDEHSQPADAPVAMDRHCAACVALPALDHPLGGPLPAPQPLLRSTNAELLLGLRPNVATPPPKDA